MTAVREVDRRDRTAVRAFVVGGQTIDALTFAWAIFAAPALMGHEMNPITHAIVAAVGVWGFVVVKIGLAALTAALIRPSTRGAYLWIALAVGVTGVIGALFNIYAVTQVT